MDHLTRDRTSLLNDLLLRTSRTFALAIPLLPEPVRTDVTLAYLVFRIADTLEDAENLGRNERQQALQDFARLLHRPTPLRIQQFTRRWSDPPPSTNESYVVLLRHTPELFETLTTRPALAREPILFHARRSTLGMASVVAAAKSDGSLQLVSLEQLRRYCYCVAGIVGEMLTQIFHARVQRIPLTRQLWDDARRFGEGLQLVNILKDSAEDQQQGRQFLPAQTRLADIFQLARESLTCAQRYVEHLRRTGAPPGYLAFVRLPLELACDTLDQVERDGPGAKLSRQHVGQVLRAVLAETHSAWNQLPPPIASSDDTRSPCHRMSTGRSGDLTSDTPADCPRGGREQVPH